MSGWEYHIVPAPRRGVKAKGARTAEERFAVALSEAMNGLGAEGWDYVRTDILPCEERQGLTGKTTVYHAMMVFRRPLAGDDTPEAVPPVARLPSPAAIPAVAPPVLAATAPEGPAAAPPVLSAVPPAPPAVPPLGPAGRATD